MSRPLPAGCAVVLFALEREAVPFRGMTQSGVAVGVTGVGPAAGRHAAQILASTSPRLVVMAGFCGALVSHLKVGDIVMSPRIVTVPHLVATPAEKRRLAEQSGADAVDMESAAVAEACTERGVPFLAVRAVSDTVDTALSPELVWLLSGGQISIWKAMAALVRRPALLGEFRRLARDTRLAARRLAEELVQLLSRDAESSERIALPTRSAPKTPRRG